MIWMYSVLLAAVVGGIFYLLCLPCLGAIRVDSCAAVESKTTKAWLLCMAIAVPLASLLIYSARGSSDEMELVLAMQALGEETDPGSMESIMQFQRDLEVMTLSKPEKPEYWFLLGGLHMEMQNFSRAVDAYYEASKLTPADISIHARLAEAQFMADDYSLTPAVRVHVDRVLEADPYDTTVLGILGISAYRAGQFEAAIRFWQRSIEALPPMSPSVQSIQASIEQARVAGGIVEMHTDTNADTDVSHQNNTEFEPDGIFFDLDVSIAANVFVSPDDFVFVFARQYGGPPMPVVVERISVSQLPIRLRMDDSKVMIVGRRLADFEQLELVARLSYSGSPTAEVGDYEKVIGPVSPNNIQGVIELEISERINE